jgi:hypothetical protein
VTLLPHSKLHQEGLADRGPERVRCQVFSTSTRWTCAWPATFTPTNGRIPCIEGGSLRMGPYTSRSAQVHQTAAVMIACWLSCTHATVPDLAWSCRRHARRFDQLVAASAGLVRHLACPLHAFECVDPV